MGAFVDRQGQRVRDAHEGDDDREPEHHVHQTEDPVDPLRDRRDVLRPLHVRGSEPPSDPLHGGRPGVDPATGLQRDEHDPVEAAIARGGLDTARGSR